MVKLFGMGLPTQILSALDAAKAKIERGGSQESKVLPAISAMGDLAVIIARSIVKEENSEEGGDSGLSEGVIETSCEDRPSQPISDVHNSSASELNRKSQLLSLASNITLSNAVNKEDEKKQEADYMSKLESIRRGGFEKISPGTEPRRGSVLNAGIKSAIWNGLLTNNFAWLHRVLESAKKKKGAGSSLATIFNAQDEDSTSLLVLACSLGCSGAIVSYLSQGGATITDDIIRRAAYNNQIEALRQLLVEYIVKEDAIVRDQCSHEVIAVFDEAIARQARQEATLRNDGLSFLGSLIQKILQLGPFCDCNLEPGRIIRRSIAELFAGRVLLKAMDQNRHKVLASIGKSNTGIAGTDQENGRVPIFSHEATENSGSVAPSALAGCEGLLFVIPDESLDELLSKEEGVENCCLDDYLLFLEALLWCRNVDDIALGLSLTAILLRRKVTKSLPLLLRRFGIRQLIDHHRKWSQNVLDQLVENRRSGDNTSTSEKESHTEAMISGGLILCPQKHPAELHITRHSSFRCDLCGKGVDRGFPMHGCRECDWDACEDCINKGNGNVAKWRHTKSIAEECTSLFETSSPLLESEQETQNPMMSAVLNGLRLQEDAAIPQLFSLLETRGALTMFEFSHSILPTLHEAATGIFRTTGGDRRVSMNKPIPRGQGKRQKVGQSYESRKMYSLPREFLLSLVGTMILKPLEGITDSSEAAKKTNQEKPSIQPELIRRLHQLISFFEHFPIVSDEQQSGSSGELFTLTSPIELTLTPSRRNRNGEADGRQQAAFKLAVEPLLRLSELKEQILRSSAHTSSDYAKYCKCLCDDKAIICFRRPVKGHNECESGWQLAQVVSYSDGTGIHKVKLASTTIQHKEKVSNLVVDLYSKADVLDLVEFDSKETQLLLAPLNYFVVHRKIDPTRKEYRSIVQSVLISKLFLSPNETKALPKGCVPPGSRAEYTDGSGRKLCTVVGCTNNHEGNEDMVERDDDNLLYDVVLDSDEVILSVPTNKIHCDTIVTTPRGHRSAGEDETEGQSGAPMISLGRFEGRDENAPTETNPCVLKRTWSALALRDEPSPVDIAPKMQGIKLTSSKCLDVSIDVGNRKKALLLKNMSVENPPELDVVFTSMDPNVPPVSTQEATVFSLLRLPGGSTTKCNELRKGQAYFSIDMQKDEYHGKRGSVICRGEDGVPLAAADTKNLPGEENSDQIDENMESSMHIDRYFESIGIGEEQAVERCIGLIDLFGAICEDLFEDEDSEPHKLSKESIMNTLQSQHLTNKLLEQIENPLVVASGSIPEWCTTMPSLSPRLFAYEARRTLLERSAFGVSRSVMKQQESKVKVKALRDRMAALRGRAVELVGEAFSGGAEDPTALQLQADELYGMEEALKARVNAAFRAQKWKERTLQCVKAAVHRETLLADAASIMDSYANNPSIKQRRLEIRFAGESGFDAASGDEAGVTRGFYADIAESLLNVEFVSEAQCSLGCDAKVPAESLKESKETFQVHQTRLPLWIPDTANGAVLPSPRARLDSSPGVYPRPLSPHDPQIQAVIAQFRFMGRVFACAMRDSFMFPLPLSSAFLKLVQFGNLDEERPDETKQPATTTSPAHSAETRKDPTSPCRPTELSFDEMSCYENTPNTGHLKAGYLGSDQGHNLKLKQRPRLTIKDLPRPGFFGGEIFAVLTHTCKKLDEIDSTSLPSELEEKYRELASSQDFAREALGKDYDCSFEAFFDGKVFVDPLDPAQDDQSVPLCQQGHLREVTIHNVREWAELAKEFFLHDGVIQQAIAFREGVNDFFSSDYLKMFIAEELQRDVCGGGDNVERWAEEDVKNLFSMSGAKGANEALVAVAAIGGEGGAALSRRFGSSSPTIGFLVKALLDGTPIQRRQFLNFVTSVPIVTPGKIEVVPIVSPSGEFLPVNETVMPRANTCARRLYLPKFDGYENFSKILWAVIQEESKFKGFYEWRG
eukprot:CAMPEP_0202444320 /NCGR_PEP_ID=MMETSP1360-20130828/3445_1 /ASSEMBLY_ACC=CAM_ASM_000848 /TAXON_ID=515479 /ORGANISM="Licmophora paradoxa, Strain CCMP2313" /LENGTH=1953 /DNA_ID=CAMNT_0049060293 /DNA_START=27 /DNA_END=5888 /DNA_ORIENTATION=-